MYIHVFHFLQNTPFFGINLTRLRTWTQVRKNKLLLSLVEIYINRLETIYPGKNSTTINRLNRFVWLERIYITDD